MTTFAYDYQNQYTRGWVRGEFEEVPADRVAAVALLTKTAGVWANGTLLRLVEIDPTGKETYLDTATGNRGPLPIDR